jgi:shikimate kinase
MRNIYLIGMMGSGKSVTGKRLAVKLGCGFVDLDDLIEKKAGKSITQIFSEKGEPYFRDLEAQILKETSAEEMKVVATGGGAILRHANVELMRATGQVIFLEASPEILWERVKDKKDRPLSRGGKPQERLLEIYATRKPLYEGASHDKINTDGKTAGAVADEICQILDAKA